MQFKLLLNAEVNIEFVLYPVFRLPEDIFPLNIVKTVQMSCQIAGKRLQDILDTIFLDE